MATKAFAPAKVNLALHVTGQRADGYHLLDSLVVFADVGDHLTLSPAPDLSLAVEGPMAAGVPTDGTNLILKAARFAGLSGGRFALEKHLPAAAGIGGGSSDAAAALRAVAQMTGTRVPQGTDQLGADVPVCLDPRASRMRGIGEEITPIDGFPTLPAVLVNPGVGVSTPDVFRALDRKDNPALPDVIPPFGGVADCVDWLGATRNDLEAPARTLEPVIDRVLGALGDAELCRMSGSGATCFGLYPDMEAARAAAERIRTAYPNWWVAACRLS